MESLVRSTTETARKSPHMVVALVKDAVEAAPEVAARLKEDVATFVEVRRAKKAGKGPAQPSMDAAAE
jgi:hypothetical protein